ncbi:DUF6463 family protein [Aliikangiella coralliicola]|uniref:Molecular chaperone GroEL n=1 Tax=Aliikangiella coralliicola TaxID=2592383 RepID=A0A545UIM7_9GAMM|nr:DUF6463 family protein [Aliikangiella coralliicola]TQV89324.1 molecular chaperone GroEL [Aliikangiella coralliicola]
MKHWKSTWIIGVAILHTIYAIVVFGEEYILLFENGLFNSVSSPRSALAVWFFLFGQLLFVVALLVQAIERSDSKEKTKLTGINLLLMTIIGVTIMPASGFWLMLPPAIAMLLSKSESPENSTAT